MEELEVKEKLEVEVKAILERELSDTYKIPTLQDLTQIVQSEGHDLKCSKVRSLVKNELKYRWGRFRSEQSYINSSDNILLRHMFSLSLITILATRGLKVINFDECKVQETFSKRYCWLKKRGKVTKIVSRR